ncbi:MAG: tRNA (N(6)-L-threonylcarbamoyladenosine(37)-C(2))-methylthiotransferase [Candidatus Nezhaarchaeales archaeon]
MVKGVLKGGKVVALENADKAKPSLSLPRVRVNPVVGVIPISYGCLGSCTYCCVVLARGRLRSYSVGEIVERVKADLAEGVREFWLTAQDTGCYGRGAGTSLAELIEAVCAVDGDFKVRVGMMTPNMALSILESLIKAYKSEKVFKFVHLPVQSGDDRVLEKMRRFYTAADFKRVVNAFKAAFPEMTIATDIICGFPGEDEKAFEKTLRLIEEVKLDVVNVSKFFARPRTPAAAMKDAVPPTEIKRRSAILSSLAMKIALKRNREWVGWEGRWFMDG